jgi:hypothetical protein
MFLYMFPDIQSQKGCASFEINTAVVMQFTAAVI